MPTTIKLRTTKRSLWMHILDQCIEILFWYTIAQDNALNDDSTDEERVIIRVMRRIAVAGSMAVAGVLFYFDIVSAGGMFATAIAFFYFFGALYILVLQVRR